MEQAQLERDYEHFMEERALYEEMLEKGYRNNPRRARRNGALGTTLALAAGFGAGVFAEKSYHLSAKIKPSGKARKAPVKAPPVTDAKWRVERWGGTAVHVRTLGGVKYVVSKSRWDKAYYADYFPVEGRPSKRVKGPLESDQFSSKADAIAAAEAHAGLAKSNPRRARRNRGSAQTQTAAFKRWFGDSKVVDENGQPKVVYHGTQSEPFYTFPVSYTHLTLPTKRIV